ncbi:hypothetical protein QFC21_000099 [Naganishia friedmannii]|uniref:Uncharacterized protein n=1 Tax=Naganishia friedmannii TaxID=89922 RepID=A0ACC2WC58_9TREE|nr:hypothetical protein QFC21_000099 [Naganishia friedmannii]
MQFTFLFALLPLLASVAQAGNQPGLDIRVVKDNSKRGNDDALARRAGESVVNSYVQCEQVCRAYFGPSGTPATGTAAPTLVQLARSSATSRAVTTSTRVATPVVASSTKASTSLAALPTVNSNAVTLTADEQRMLSEHNTFRAKYGAKALTWDSTLATYAKNYASQCKFAHSGGPYGENLASSYGYSDPIGVGLTGWEQEASKYDYNNPTFSSATGHFTQPFRTLTSASSRLGQSSSSYVICEYNTPGNYLGQFATQVGRPV